VYVGQAIEASILKVISSTFWRSKGRVSSRHSRPKSRTVQKVIYDRRFWLWCFTAWVA